MSILNIVQDRMKSEVNIFAFPNEDNTYEIFYRDHKGRERRYMKKVRNADQASIIMCHLETKYNHHYETSLMGFNPELVYSDPMLQEMFKDEIKERISK